MASIKKKRYFETIVRIFALFLVAITLMLSLTQCKDPEDSEQTPTETPTYQGTHSFEYKATDKDFVKNGKTDYTVVIPDDASDLIKTAAQEFGYLFSIATGISIKTGIDTNLSHNASNKYVSIGETSLLETSGIEIDREELGKDGVRIVTKDNTVYLVGGSDYGSLYAVYDFMKVAFHYEQYFADCMEIDKNVTDLKLYDFNVKNIPDIPLRPINYGFLKTGSEDYDESMLGYRLRIAKDRGEYFMPIFSDYKTTSYSAKSTNTNTYLPYNTYYETHSDWFSNNCINGEYQLCYTAHGNEAELQLMLEECAKKIQFSMQHFTPEKYPDMNVVTLTMEDNFQTCSCSECLRLASDDMYGTEAGAVVIFMNRLGEIIEQWQNKPENAAYKRDNFKLIFFAYNSFENPPVKQNENGEYEPINENIRCRENVGVYLAICNNIEFQKSFFDEINELGREQLEGWSTLTDFLYFWTYETNFKYYMYFYDSFDFFNTQAYQYIASFKPEMFFAQGQEASGDSGTTWNNLKAYLNAKLSWDSSLDTNTLIDNWFKAMYHEAAPVMKDYFYAMRLYNASLLEKRSLYKVRSNYTDIAKRQYWPLATLESWIKACDNAKLAVEKYKTKNPELYQSICNHIETEAVSPIYTILTLHKNQISSTRKAELTDRIVRDIVDLGMERKRITEHSGFFSDVIANL